MVRWKASKSRQPHIIPARKEIHHNERFKVNHATHATFSVSLSYTRHPVSSVSNSSLRPKPDHHHPNSNMPPPGRARVASRSSTHVEDCSRAIHARIRRLVNAQDDTACVKGLVDAQRVWPAE